MRNTITSMMVLSLSVLHLVQPASAASVSTLEQLNNGSITYAQQFEGTYATVIMENSIGELFFTGSASLLQDQTGTAARTGLTAAHVMDFLDDPANDIVQSYISIGSNYLTDLGALYPISSYLKHEDWIDLDHFLGPGGSEPDLAGFVLEEPIFGAGARIAAATPLGIVATSVGAGLPGTPITGFLPRDGYMRAFDLDLETRGLYGFSQDYIWGQFNPGDPITYGIATPGDSGSGVRNAANELLGITVLQSGGSPGWGASTGLLDIQPYVPWIYDNGFVPVPEPATLSLLFVGGLLGMRRRHA